MESGPLGPQRSIWDIIWSCLSTIYACTWVPTHPDVPVSHKNFMKGLIQSRFGLMCCAIIAPEFIMVWGIQQRLGARRLALKYKEYGWTKVYGHFLQMGGFALNYGGDNLILNEDLLDKLLRWRKRQKIYFELITEEEIKDRSKSDGLSKTIAAGQTLWFIVQCITRRVKGLVVTEMELAASAYAILNIGIFIIWWDKPMDVRYPVPIHLWDMQRRCDFESLRREVRNPSVRIHGEILIWGLIIGSIFGGIHCLGWNFIFPSLAELISWRVCSLLITIAPVLSAILLWYDSKKTSPILLSHLTVPAQLLLSILYLISRLFLLVEAFASLRKLPPGAYSAVEWVTFIPHI
ncbi:hypothetical protein CPB84DRAFT_1779103 [Gymnopilus junonius]|uniref:Uncharacterized protein n=1 Tax=Gymnopilus junonius TaxID=109634 RepID=A0A9P5TM26_GYMJU|nr:hypothetical protein CPB84DRAFT_1779103 [Gymnopilus junonius]